MKGLSAAKAEPKNFGAKSIVPAQQLAHRHELG